MEDNKEVVISEDRDNIPTLSKRNETSTQLAPSINPNSLSKINLFDEKQLIAAENFITKVMRSEKGGIKSVNDGLAVLMRAQDLNLPFSTCLEHIHVINGKTGVDIHVIKALLLKAGVTWDCINDYTPLYEFTDGINVYVDGEFPDYVVRCKSADEAREKSEKDEDHVYVYPVKFYKDFKGNIYRDYQLNKNQFGIAVNKEQVAAIAKENKIPVIRIPSQPINFIAKYEFRRIVNNVCMSSIGKFTYKEALQAEMFEKDTYKKYPSIMIKIRAFTYGARDIASDVLFGVMETTELKIVSGVELSDKDVDYQEI